VLTCLHNANDFGNRAGPSDTNGLTGDLKTSVERQWDAVGETWSAGDTTYFRYDIGTAGGTGFAHGVKRVVLPNAYAALAAYAAAQETTVEALADEAVAPFTCFYYEYGIDRRVSRQEVFGESGSTELTVALNDDDNYADGPNTWKRKTVETRGDGSTATVFVNYLGQTILTDLYDAASATHTLGYNRYDAAGRLVLSADSASFVLYNDEYYDESLLDLVNYSGGDSPYLANAAGLFHVTTYYASTSQGIDEDTAGGVAGYAWQTAVAHGESAARLAVGAQGGPIATAAYEYFARTVGGDTIFPLASYTVYADEAGANEITTTYAYTWHAGTLQIAEQTTTLPVVSVEQNGLGTAATTKQWFDASGNLRWSMNELGRVTYNAYDSLTGQLTETIADIDSATATSLGFTQTGWTWLATSPYVSATTDYQHDALGRITRSLGPAHLADIGGTMTNVRTATWVVYLDAVHETRTAQGYATETSPGVWTTYAIMGPISIKKTDRDGRTTDQIQATYSGTVANLVTATISQSDYTAWTTYQYSKTRLISMRVYDDIPSSGTGTLGTNYDQTSYGYENFGEPGVLMGRQNRVETPDGTITRYVFDARGNVLETWVGTDDIGAPDADPTGGSAQGNNMVLMSSATYDADGNQITSTDALSRTTEYAYDWRGRMTARTDPDPDGQGQLES